MEKVSPEDKWHEEMMHFLNTGLSPPRTRTEEPINETLQEGREDEEPTPNMITEVQPIERISTQPDALPLIPTNQP